MKDKKDIVAAIAVYTKRKQKYRKQANNCSKKIKSLQATLRYKVKRAKNFEEFKSKTKEFFGEIPQKRMKNEFRLLIQCLICKYGLENGQNGADIANLLGYKRSRTVAEKRRKALTLLNEDNKQLWVDYKKFMMT